MKSSVRWTLLFASFLLVTPIGCKKDEASGTDEQGAEVTGEESPEAAVAADPSGEDEAAAGDEAPSEESEAAEGADDEDGNPFGITSSVELLEQGSEPRRELRYDLAAIEATTVRFTMLTSSSVTAGEQGQREMALPKMTIDLAMKNPTMQDDGNLRVDFELLDIAYEATGDDQQSQMMAQMMEQQLGSFEYSGHYTLNARGQVIDGEINMDDTNPQIAQMSENIEQSLQQITTAFPEEAVGVGATWKVNQNYGEALPFELDQNVVFEILSIDGNKITLKTTIDQSAEAQTIRDESMPEGTSVELEEFKTDGSGEIEFALDSLTPEGQLTVNMTMAMKGTMPGQGEQSMRTEMTMEMTMGAAPAGAGRQEAGQEAAE